MSDEKPIRDEKSELMYEERHIERGPGGGDPRSQWLPEAYEYQAKSLLNSEQVRRLVVLRAILKRHEDWIEDSEILDQMIVEYMATTPSIEGRARAEQVSVLTNGLSDQEGGGGLGEWLAKLRSPGDDDD